MEIIVFLLCWLWNDKWKIAYVQYKHKVYNIFVPWLLEFLVVKALDMKGWMNTITVTTKLSGVYHNPWLEQSCHF